MFYGFSLDTDQFIPGFFGFESKRIDNLEINATSNTLQPLQNLVFTVSGGTPYDGVYPGNDGQQLLLYIEDEVINMVITITADNHSGAIIVVNHLGDNFIFEEDIELEFNLGNFSCGIEFKKDNETEDDLGTNLQTNANSIFNALFTDLSGSAPDPNLYAYIHRMEPAGSIDEKAIHEFSSEYGGYPSCPMIALEGESGTVVTVDVDTITASIRIDYTKLIPNTPYKVSVRIIYKV